MKLVFLGLTHRLLLEVVKNAPTTVSLAMKMENVSAATKIMTTDNSTMVP